MKVYDGLETHSPTWQGARKMFRAEIELARDALEAEGLEQRTADGLRGRIKALRELLGLGEIQGPVVQAAKSIDRSGY